MGNITTGGVDRAIGSGKSLIASKLAKMNNVIVNMDTIARMIGGGEYGLYDKEKKEIYHATEEVIITKALKQGFSVVIDRTNMDKKRRQRFINIGKQYAKEIIAYDWGSGSEEQLQRRLKYPQGVPVDTWRNVFEFMKKSYEIPTEDEGFSKIIKTPQKFKFYAFDFDGVIVENKFPEIGEIIDGTVNKINALYEDLANIIIVWTCRSGDFEHRIRDFMLKHKILFDFINENPIVDFGSRKIFAHEYYDDRNK